MNYFSGGWLRKLIHDGVAFVFRVIALLCDSLGIRFGNDVRHLCRRRTIDSDARLQPSPIRSDLRRTHTFSSHTESSPGPQFTIMLFIRGLRLEWLGQEFADRKPGF